MNADTLAKALAGRRAGSAWMARCPTHDDRQPSLSIRETDDGKVLIHCHAGCDQDQVITALRGYGLWTWKIELRPLRRRSPHPRDREPDVEATNRTLAAMALWRSAVPAAGTLVEAYLASRGLKDTPPPALRFQRALKHPSGGHWPAMVALVTRGRDEAPVAIHRTFLAANGLGKAPVEPQRMMLGPCRSGAVRLGDPENGLMVGEGVETCLAAMQAIGRPAWAALSTSGLRTLDLPDAVRDVTVLADGDEPGAAAARECARRWSREGRRVRIAWPPPGRDFNDLLHGRRAVVMEGAP